jgi:anti-anti-sigma regulatory factor
VLDDLINAQGNLSVSVDLGRLWRLAHAGAEVLAAAIVAARQRQGVLQFMAPRPAPAGTSAFWPVRPQDAR